MPRQLLAALLVLLLAPPTHAAELIVGAASVLSNAFTELGRAFNSRHPGDTVNFRFALSGILLQQQQIGSGEVDMLALNDDLSMNEAANLGLLRNHTRIPFASNRLVLVVQAKSSLPARGVTDLERWNIRRVAIENSATTPAGRYSRLALIEAGIWKAVEAKAVWGQNSHECLELVATGAADAGFALASEAARRTDEVRIVTTVSTPEPIRYAIATTVRARQPRLANQFSEFIRSQDGQAILERYGFGTIETPPSSSTGGASLNPREMHVNTAEKRKK
jgi:molybdate transport system substrate-binding protein